MFELTRVTITHIVVSAGLFLLLWATFGRILMKPFFDVVLEREERTSLSDEKSAGLRAEAAKLDSTLSTMLRDAQLEGLRARDEIVAKAKAEADSIRTAAAERIAAAAAQNNKEIERLRSQTQIEAEVEGLAALLVGRVLTPSSERTFH